MLKVQIFAYLKKPASSSRQNICNSASLFLAAALAVYCLSRTCSD